MIKIAVLISLMLAAYLTSEKKCEREENKVVIQDLSMLIKLFGTNKEGYNEDYCIKEKGNYYSD